MRRARGCGPRARGPKARAPGANWARPATYSGPSRDSGAPLRLKHEKVCKVVSSCAKFGTRGSGCVHWVMGADGA
eukprot:7378389-Prymnesium_polylepis.1